MSDYNDSNLSKPTGQKTETQGPIRQHKRLAMGEKVDATSNPNGRPSPTQNKTNQPKAW